MSKFWQKKYISKYTGKEIDAAVAKAGNLPAVTSADAGKALVVDEEGKIVAGEAGGSANVIIRVEDLTPIAEDEFDLGYSYNALVAFMEAGTNVILNNSRLLQSESETKGRFIMSTLTHNFSNPEYGIDESFEALFYLGSYTLTASAVTASDNMALALK